MFKQGPSELPEAHYKYKLNISLRLWREIWSLKRKGGGQKKREGRKGGRRQVEADENEAGF